MQDVQSQETTQRDCTRKIVEIKLQETQRTEVHYTQKSPNLSYVTVRGK